VVKATIVAENYYSKINAALKVGGRGALIVGSIVEHILLERILPPRFSFSCTEIMKLFSSYITVFKIIHE
jgi:hypothetical protein